MHRSRRWVTVHAAFAAGCCISANGADDVKLQAVRLMTLDPGHFHAALVQKSMYPGVDPIVHVYAPSGPDLEGHLARINGYNSRTNDPTSWQQVLHPGTDYLEKMLAEKPGNVVVISGNNAKKGQYILASVQAGLNVLSDKPMAIKPADFDVLREAFAVAEKKGVLLYDIMTERSEITTILQRELSLMPSVFGTLEKGSPDKPAVTKESVHHFFKTVSGSPLKRPAWFYDVTQQGEGIVDVTTHLVDLIQWECFPEQIIDWQKDIAIGSAKRWATKVTPEQFQRSTQQATWPEFLKKDVDAESNLNVYANGEINYTLRGVHAKVSVTWNFEAPAGAGDTHYSTMRGTRANLVIRQGAEQGYKPTLYIEPVGGVTNLAGVVDEAVARLQKNYPGVALKKIPAGWEVVIPEAFKVGHEAHFAQVTERFLKYLAAGKLPPWEVPNMIAKYFTTTKAYELSR